MIAGSVENGQVCLERTPGRSHEGTAPDLLSAGAETHQNLLTTQCKYGVYGLDEWIIMAMRPHNPWTFSRPAPAQCDSARIYRKIRYVNY